MAFDALDGAPCGWKTGSAEVVDDGLPVYLGVVATGGFAEDTADGPTQTIVPLGVESGPILVSWADDGRFRAPVLGDVDGGGVSRVQCVVQVLAKRPATL